MSDCPNPYGLAARGTPGVRVWTSVVIHLAFGMENKQNVQSEVVESWTYGASTAVTLEEGTTRTRVKVLMG